MVSSDFTYKEQSLGLVKVFNLSGKIMGGPEIQLMCERVKKLSSQDTRFFVMNFRNVKFINSNGIGMLIACLTSLRNNGGDLRFANVQGASWKYFHITKLDTVIKIFNGVNEAVNSYFSPS